MEEIRLRAGRCPSLTLGGGERLFSRRRMEERDLRTVLELASGSSYHTAEAGLREGFLTARGGFRIGVAGTAVLQGESVAGFRELSSLCIRVGRALPGVSLPLMRQMGGPFHMPSTLILSPPGLGKTTLLRDLVLQLSLAGIPVGLADERGEIAGLWEGVPQFEVGPCTDVMDGCPREQAVRMLIRSLRPRVVAVDEISRRGDYDALRLALGAGVRVLATVHGGEREDLRLRPGLWALMQEGAFGAVVNIAAVKGERSYVLSPWKGEKTR